jgi:hypothetical protein
MNGGYDFLVGVICGAFLVGLSGWRAIGRVHKACDESIARIYADRRKCEAVDE